ncbi:MAG: PAS domain S-box protein [Comamonas sp.]|jgi:PAS domain S-box-containing protein|uniref:MHYT domain-containing protein n=1 Tax=Comamonas sp. TaxID=34028 RepID=UPI002824CF6B|nr:MHYT domain-containing protein [Comamonas sp.]MDR0216951.1 PAS domain S-box protein [Comamonas sp.]
MQSNFFWSQAPGAALLQGEYDLGLVLLSLMVSSIAASQALRLAAFARQAVTPQLRSWAIASGSLALGTGIWAMHFIGMLAYTPHAAVQYDLPLTILSILPGIAASAVAITLLAKAELSSKQLVLGGIIMGAGIATMHYSGMGAMRMEHTPQYSPAWFTVSLLVGVALAMLALWVRFGLARFSDNLSLGMKTLAAIIMGCAVAGMHYTAMLALRISVPESTHVDSGTPHGDNQLVLALVIALVTLSIGGLIAQANGSLHYRTRWQKTDMDEARLRALVQMAADGIISIDTLGNVQEYNPAAEAIFGWSMEEVVGQNVKMLMPAALANQHDHYIQRHEQGQMNAQPPLRNKISEVLGQHKNGTLIPLRLALSQAESRGQRMYVGVLTDLSDRKKTERQLHIAATVFDHCFEGVVVLDANRRVADINPAFARMAEISRRSARNKDFMVLFHSDEDDAGTTSMWTEVGRNGHWQGSWTMRHNGSLQEVSITAVRDEQHRLHHYIAICYQPIKQEQPSLI